MVVAQSISEVFDTILIASTPVSSDIFAMRKCYHDKNKWNYLRTNLVLVFTLISGDAKCEGAIGLCTGFESVAVGNSFDRARG